MCLFQGSYFFFSFLNLFDNVLYSSRTEYTDDEIEFVLENLDISGFNILPSHVYIRNITDVDIVTSDTLSAPSRTGIGTLTHVHI